MVFYAQSPIRVISGPVRVETVCDLHRLYIVCSKYLFYILILQKSSESELEIGVFRSKH